ncbi:MAG: AAA family ATPase [Deltaproteobacteria bacterium]|nr:AAA family ATPase [Deltaproteobacteria bacterium]
MMNIQKEIITWLHDRPNWQQEAVARSLANGHISDLDLDELTALCKIGDGQKVAVEQSFSGIDGYDAPQNQSLRIVSIGDIQGIENLRPRKPILFGERNLVVVYGGNGSGKSGYVRIIKKACGKEKARELRANIFAEVPSKRCCKIEYKIDKVKEAKEWMADGVPLGELAGIDIFDTDSGRLYLSKESEVSYKPRSVAIFDDLVRACEGVRHRLQQEKNALFSKLPTIPFEYTNTQSGKLFGNLKATHTESELTSILFWSKEDQEKLNELEERLKGDDPARLAAKKRTQKSEIENILNKITNALSAFGPESCEKLTDLKTQAYKKRKIAMEGAAQLLQSASLDGVGTDTWRALWEAARRYSEEKAYQTFTFPYTADGAKCVLCQQLLLPEAQQRLSEFDGYVKGELEETARVIEMECKDKLGLLPTILDDDSLRTSCHAAGLEEDWMERLASLWKAAAITKKQLLGASLDKNAGIERNTYPWVEVLQEQSANLEKQAQQHDEDAKSFDNAKALKDKIELKAKQWTSQQADSIKKELPRLKKIAQYDELIRGTDHTAISNKAGNIAKKIITVAYIRRFNDELDKLGAKRIKVELVKTRVAYGKPMHSIKLRGATVVGVAPLDILSEGEKRIIELAAFLADVTGRPSKAPFIFDDPISSLDQDFEEKTIDRLIGLSADRQVIIFTHRLSFLGILCDKSDPDTVCIRNEPWGTGEPGDVPLFGKRPDKALNKLHDERLAQAEKVLQDHGSEAYYPLAKSICTDFRILVERIVELVLLADVVQRHRRDINTKGKIDNLCKIRKEDCEVIDHFMTKYSPYEHSQSFEAPVNVPDPESIRKDIESLLEWHNEYKTRPVELSK